MTASDLEIKISHKINKIAAKMIEEGVPVSLALYIANYASSETLSGSDKDVIFSLMSQWDIELNEDKKKDIFSEMSKIVENRRLQNLSTKF